MILSKQKLNTLVMNLNSVLCLFSVLFELITAFPLSLYEWFFARRTNVEGQVVVITGAGGGIGSRIAVEFAKLGANLVLIDKDQAMNLRTKEELLKSFKIKIKCFECDISKPEMVDQVASDVISDPEMGTPLVLVCNAGILVAKCFMQYTVAEIRNVFDVNTLGYFWTIRSFLPKMLDRGDCHIAMLCSGSAYAGHKHLSAYCASKYALRGLMESLTQELQDRYKGINVKITNIYPFIANTQMLDPYLVESNWMPYRINDIVGRLINAQYIPRT